MLDLLCPVCGGRLAREKTVWRCESRHSFDVARSGYVNLLPPSASGKRHGDDKRMVAARTAFLSRGYYDHLIGAVAGSCAQLTGPDACVLDAGCGEGTYTRAIYDALAAKGGCPQLLGADISAEAVRRAARQVPEGIFCAASTAHLPLAAESLDLIVNIFSPLMAEEFLRVVPEKQPFMATSCCPAWSVMAKKEFPGFAPYISMTMTPMVLTARLQKRRNPDCKIAFIGPCAAKKLEASRRSVRSEVDFVLTFEELMGLFEAKAVNFADLSDNPEDAFNSASADARGFAASGGVAQAVVNAIKKMDPDREVKVMSAQGLADCKKMMMMAKAGKYNGYLLEGMACPGGCIAGAGTLADPAKSVAMLNKYKNEATMKVATETPYQDSLDLLHY